MGEEFSVKPRCNGFCFSSKIGLILFFRITSKSLVNTGVIVIPW